MTERTKKGWNRRLALGGGAAAALGAGYLAFHKPSGNVRAVQIEAGTLHRGNGAEPESLDPALAQGNYEDFIMADLLTGLFVSNPEGRPAPGMATDWQTSSDGLIWTFKLREALWSDGTAVAAEDFIFSWQRILNPGTAGPYSYFLYPIKNAQAINSGKLPMTALGVRAIDPHTLEITLEHPVPYLLEVLAHMTMYPEPRHVVEAKGKDWTRPGNYVGNGAYVLAEWVPNDHITLVKNPHFFDAANVAIERVIYYPTDDYSAALRRMRAGELDVQDRAPGQQMEWIKANLPQIINPVPQMTLEYIAINLKRAPFTDKRVREAMNMVINREVITGKISRLGEQPAYNVIPPGTVNFPGGNALSFKAMPYPQRLDSARTLMREAGFGPDKRANCTYALRSTSPGTTRSIAALLQQLFGLIYIDLSIVPFDAAIFYKNVQIHNFDLAQAAWGADFNDAETFLALLETDNGNNYGEYSNPAFDALLTQSRHDVDLVSRGQKLAQAEAIALADQAICPLFFWVTTDLVWPYVKGWVANNMDLHRTRWVSIDEAARRAQFSSTVRT